MPATKRKGNRIERDRSLNRELRFPYKAFRETIEFLRKSRDSALADVLEGIYEKNMEKATRRSIVSGELRVYTQRDIAIRAAIEALEADDR